MNPTDPHTTPPETISQQADPNLTGLLPEITEPEVVDKTGRPGGRRTRLANAGLIAAAVGLVLLATWLLLQKRNMAPTSTGDPIPKDAVRIINSLTPVPERQSPLTATDTAGSLDDPPESASWTPALADAHRAQDEGRYASAISQYAALVSSAPAPEAHNALWGLASAYQDAGQDDLAIRAYSLFTYLRDDPRAARAYFRIAEIHRAHGRWTPAQEAYKEYNRYAGPARHAIMLLRADLFGDSTDAIEVYESVLDDHPQSVDKRDALLGLAGVYSALSRNTDAARIYGELADLQASAPRPMLDQTGEPARVRQAEELLSAKDKEGARKLLLDYISKNSTYPFGTYAAVNQFLFLDPQAVVSGTIQPALAAKAAFDSGYYGKAIGFLVTERHTQTDPDKRAAASLLTGRAFALTGNLTDALNWYTSTAQTYPTSKEAPMALRRAGDALEEQSLWDDALAAFTQTVTLYPQSEDAAIAGLHGGLLAYRLEKRDVALNLLSPLVAQKELSPTLKAEALFWKAKIDRGTGKTDWRSTMEQVRALSPGSFRAFRARSLLDGEPEGGPEVRTFTGTQLSSVSMGINYSSEAAQRSEMLAWATNIAGKTNPTPGTPATTRSDTASKINSDPEVQRAVALLQLGYTREAYPAFRALAERLRIEGDAEGLAHMVLYLRYNADPRTAMRAAEQLGALDPANDPEKWPLLLLKTLYPAPYKELVMKEAQERDIDPLLVYALMRQESQFVPGAQSGADARGLTQVIPSTGQGIAAQLGDNEFKVENLYNPEVSIRYGTYYLASNLPQFNRKMLPALAAYNGGPGNAARWMQGSALIDADLFSERIDLYETEDYLAQVYRNFGFYRLAYER